MIDLDSLAEKQAKSLNEIESGWREAVWSSEFQKISESMSDGEVESLISVCPSLRHFDAVIKFLYSQESAKGSSPYLVLLESARDAGLDLATWIARLLK